MGKRLGRKRLYTLDKLGEKSTKSVGAGNASIVGSQTQKRQGSELITEILIDLGSSAGAASCFGDHATGLIIGNTVGEEGGIVTIAQATHGVVTDVEFICLETPLNGDADIDIAMNNAGTNLVSGSSAATTIIQAGGNLGIGVSKAYAATASLDTQVLTLRSGHASDPTDGAYGGGKFILRLYGHEVFDDL